MSRLARALGSEPGEEQTLPAAAALGLALAALPLLLLLPLDTDRAVPLAFLPAVCLGWRLSRPCARLDLALVICAFTAMLLSAALSDHTARALVMTSSVAWTVAGAMVARNLSGKPTAIRIVLAGLLAGAALGTVLLRLGVDSPSPNFPIYGNARLFGAHQFFGAAAGVALLAGIRQRGLILALAVATTLVAWSGLFWSGSRAPIAAMTVLVAVWIWRANPETRRRLFRWIPVLVALGLAISYLLNSPYPGMGWFNAVERTVAANGVQAVSSDRSVFWSDTWNHALKSPFFGDGADGYRFIRPAQNGSQPHNMLLQWFVEYGLLGLVPLGMLLIRGVTAPRNGGEAPPELSWPAAALAGAAAYGLLEGVFYHATAFMPAAVVAGLAIGARSPGNTPASAKPLIPVLRPLLLGASLLMLLHGWLGLVLLKGRPVEPSSSTARLLRTFPSTTLGLQNWIEAWRKDRPELAMEWIRWAQDVSTEGASFHVYAAQLYIWQKDYKSAETELLRCLEKAHRLERPDILNAIDTVRALAAGKPIPPPPSSP